MTRDDFSATVLAAAAVAAEALRRAGVVVPLGELCAGIAETAAPHAGIPMPCAGPRDIGCDCEHDCMLGPVRPGAPGEVAFDACRMELAKGH